MRKIATRALQLLTVVLALFLGVAVAMPASAATNYNRSAAVAYAKQYSCNEKEACRNSAYNNMGTADCTNFVSQALRAGGKQNSQTGPAIWYWLTKPNYSNSFVQVPKLKEFLGQKSRSETWKVDMGSAYTNARAGDLYLYDWGRGEGWSHLSMETGYGAFADYKDSKTGRNYRSITNGKGDFIAQHSKDRNGSPWNWGYQNEKDAKIKKKMKTVIIHLNDNW
ncbi:amidase domain-containing protein [Curtobacterium sp. ME26]|uniref:amidase domain-containing protein n=1 Tax=Curtobacterium sp. ME26 TaxID=2744254 RepID=UPI0015F61E90|nr:amidase domain-containing protein [Curtobacterium sp. ME26]